MIRRHRLLVEFEARSIADGSGSHQASLHVFEAMVREALELGVLPLADPLEGIELDLELARKLKVVQGTPPQD